VESLPDAVLVCDESGIIVFANARAETLFGFARSELMGRPVELLVPERHRDRHSENRARYQSRPHVRGMGSGLELVAQHKDGREIPVEVSLSPMETAEGKAVISTIRDISDRMQARHALREAETRCRRLEAALRRSRRLAALGRLSSRIAHDCNNLLQSIFSYGDIALQSLPRDSATAESVEGILNAARRCRDLMERLLRLSRKLGTDRAAVRLESIVKEGIELFRPRLPANVRVIEPKGHFPALVVGDAVQLLEVVMNLLSNGAHATKDTGGTVEIELACAFVEREIPMFNSRLRPGRYVCLRVRDTGRGMERKTRNRIFEPFFTTKGAGEGSGLGLAAVRGIVREHGGAIWFESAPGRGSCFEVYLRAAGER
jgi:hypothetical protein